MLFTSVVPILSIVCFVGAANIKSQDRIIGGESANIQEVPYQCSLSEDGSHVCGCSIISPTLILTAAHCLEDVNPSKHNLEIRAGSNKHDDGGVVKKVKSFIVNPMYNGDSMDNDSGVLRLESPLAFSNKIKSIEFDDALPVDGIKAIVSGWGLIKNNGRDLSPVLKKADVTLISRESCMKTAYKNNIKESMFCARGEGTDACQGDSGGPILNVETNKLIGIISFGFDCGSEKNPGVYSSIGRSMKFIEKAMKTLST
ncbi:trypsin beta-like [Eupeodes corollae]|uniref:trypsin beta-like n=1 Tax=Eupeodes corollae TaxID=290404 RepID=UPI0024939A2B|nr:trypsin beta-like [Eupeodes corollae]